MYLSILIYSHLSEIPLITNKNNKRNCNDLILNIIHLLGIYLLQRRGRQSCGSQLLLLASLLSRPHIPQRARTQPRWRKTFIIRIRWRHDQARPGNITRSREIEKYCLHLLSNIKLQFLDFPLDTLWPKTELTHDSRAAFLAAFAPSSYLSSHFTW